MGPPLVARRALTRPGMLSTRVPTPPGRTAAHAWRTVLFSSATVEGGHPCLGSRLTCSKKLLCHVLYGAGYCLGRTHSYVQTPQHLIPQDLDVPMQVHGSIHHDQLTPPPWCIAPHTMTNGPRFPSLGWSQASISLSPAYGAPGLDRHCGIGRIWTHH